MARSKSPTLTEAELRLMEIVWRRGEVTVGDIVEALPAEQALAYSTVLTTMRILEHKGYVHHRKEGRAFVYESLVDRTQARQSAVRYVLSRFFDNSPELLVLNLLQSDDVDDNELQRLKKMIRDKG